ncbi:hypothetical protein [Burkholderia vietnamiensis]|uniref:hypothetical protein n=1 Tax=Burkholderia vietnamiensis TaxID=60552 RepID=UPI0015930076|nr:hypothetical protein [Burkholderia vietnamiensis]
MNHNYVDFDPNGADDEVRATQRDRMNEIKHTPLEPIAVIGSGWQFLWVSPDFIATIVERTGLKIGDLLYAGALPGASADMALALEMIAAEDDAARHNGKPLLTSGVRMTLEAALIKAGRKAAPVREGE